MHDASGVGLAANQVGMLQRVFVFQPDAEEASLAVVNPASRPRDERRGRRGLPVAQGVRVPVERHRALTLEGRRARRRGCGSSSRTAARSSSTSSTISTAC